MPVAGPRTQHGPDPGYRNPENAAPTLFNLWDRPGPVWWPGRSPGTMVLTLRGNKLGFGQIRRLWRQSVNYTAAFPPFSWTDGDPSFSPPTGTNGITRALRYMTRSVYIGGGIDHTRYDELHTLIEQRHTYKTVTVNAGQKRSAPTVRNRLTSFGSRVPTLNRAVAAAESQQPGKATQA